MKTKKGKLRVAQSAGTKTRAECIDFVDVLGVLNSEIIVFAYLVKDNGSGRKKKLNW